MTSRFPKLRLIFWMLMGLPHAAHGHLQSLTDGQILFQPKTGDSQQAGYIIAFERMIHSNKGTTSWYLKGVAVRNRRGQVIASSSFAQWDEHKGVLYLEDTDQRINLLSALNPLGSNSARAAAAAAAGRLK